MKILRNFFFVNDEQHTSNYLWFFGPLIGASVIMISILLVTN